MPIDASIYSNIQPVRADLPSPYEAAQKAMSLSQMGMQQAQAQRQMQQQQAMMHAYSQNTDASTGQINHQGVASTLSNMGYSHLIPELNEGFAKQDKAQADAQSAQADSFQKRTSQFANAMNYLKGVPDAQRPEAWAKTIGQLKSAGVVTPDQQIPDTYDPQVFNGFSTAAMNHIGQNSKDFTDVRHTQAETQKALADADKARSETYKRNPDVMAQNDPAQLVPGQVPKEHQAKAFSEIDAAENTKRMAGNIMDSFEQSVKDTQGLGRITSLVKTPRSSQALHQALQPTFKDLEGTVRQAAMDNTFNNVTPNAGDTDADIAKKRLALQNYLQSKASAPTARGYGIDLAKYDSTSAYKAPAPKANSAGGTSLGGNTAYAASPAIKQGTVEGGYVFMGGDPGSKSSWKRAK